MERNELFDELFGEKVPDGPGNLADDPFAGWLLGNDNAFGSDDVANDNRKILEAVRQVSEKTKKDNHKPIKGVKGPKLDEHTLLTPKGLPALKAMFEKHRIHPDEGPYENMHRILMKMEYWAHNFHPSLNFDDFLDKVKLLGNKRLVQVAISELKSGDSIPMKQLKTEEKNLE